MLDSLNVMRLLVAYALSGEPLVDIAPAYGFPTESEAEVALMKAREQIPWEPAEHLTGDGTIFGVAISAVIPSFLASNPPPDSDLYVHLQQGIDSQKRHLIIAAATWQHHNADLGTDSTAFDGIDSEDWKPARIGSRLLGNIEDACYTIPIMRESLIKRIEDHIRDEVENASRDPHALVDEATLWLLNEAIDHEAATVARASIAYYVRKTVTKEMERTHEDGNLHVSNLMLWVRKLQQKSMRRIGDSEVASMFNLR